MPRMTNNKLLIIHCHVYIDSNHPQPDLAKSYAFGCTIVHSGGEFSNDYTNCLFQFGCICAFVTKQQTSLILPLLVPSSGLLTQISFSQNKGNNFNDDNSTTTANTLQSTSGSLLAGVPKETMDLANENSPVAGVAETVNITANIATMVDAPDLEIVGK